MEIDNYHPSYAPPVISSLFDAQPAPVQAIVQYSLGRLMVESGQADLISIEPGDNGPICTFRTNQGDIFSLARPPLTTQSEEMIIELIRKILTENG